MAGSQAVSPEREIVGCGGVSGVPWQLWEEAVEVTSGLHQNALASSVREKFWKWMAAQECWVGCISSCPFSSPPVSCSYFMEGSWQPIICSIGGHSTLWNLSVELEEKVVNQILWWKNTPWPSVTALENVSGIGCGTLCFSCHMKTIINGSFWIEQTVMADRSNFHNWARLEVYKSMRFDEQQQMNSHFHSEREHGVFSKTLLAAKDGVRQTTSCSWWWDPSGLNSWWTGQTRWNYRVQRSKLKTSTWVLLSIQDTAQK